MRTAIEALFDAMITGGWANESDGDVESPTGHFARISNTWDELDEVLCAFEDVIDVMPERESIVGDFLVVTDSQGFISIERFPNQDSLIDAFRRLQSEFFDWNSQ